MKNIIIAFLLSPSSIVFGQNDVMPIAQNGIWVEGSGSWIIDEFVYNTPTGLAIADTVNVNDTLYLKFSGFEFCDGGQIFNEHFLLREDSGKYYHRHSIDDTEQLWFDFTIAVGDTILLNRCYPESEEEQLQLTVISIEPVLLGDGSTRNKWTLQYSDNQSGLYLMTEEWIEGIGNVQQGWRHPTAQSCIDIGHWLRCYYENAEWVESFEFMPTGTSCCTLVDILEFEQDEFTIYPNPANNELNIRVHNPISTIGICDLSGRTVLEVRLSSSEANLNVEAIAKGSYILIATADDGTVTERKFIKN
jgi:hypothetical protein